MHVILWYSPKLVLKVGPVSCLVVDSRPLLSNAAPQCMIEVVKPYGESGHTKPGQPGKACMHPVYVTVCAMWT